MAGNGGVSEPDIGLATAYGLVLVLALLGNVATICNLKFNDWLKLHKCHVYILGLAVADLGTVLVPLPMHTLIAARGLLPLSWQACMAYDYFRVVIENNGVLVTLLISLDRFRLLWLNFSSYIKGSTSRRVLVELGLTWLLPVVGHGIMALIWIISVPHHIRINETTSDCQDVPSEADIPFSTLYATLLIFSPGLLLAILNTLTFIGVVRKLKRRRQIAGGTAFRGPPCATSAVRKEPSAVTGQGSDIPVVSAIRPQGAEIPSVSLSTANHHRARSDNSKRSFRPHANVNIEQTDKPGPSSAAEGQISTFDGFSQEPRGPNSLDRASNSQVRDHQRYVDRHMTRYIRPAIMLAGIVSVFTVCWFPFAVYYIYVHIVCPICFSRKIQLWLRCLVYTSSALNPFIYALTDRKLRQWYVKIWHQMRRRLRRTP
ncbi:alpha-2A adrenergic receptor-like [Acanthaster planci]|uniref:Alpha-2A adrenergic receptor-like n=1 Tax=Acanthaster planci TaxID=133434 RepID=A0A8B7XV52_ACAPL|nr:alpha-2A adrenergic receptor-like [Acanthaster planci]